MAVHVVFGAGQIGAKVARALAAQGHTVRVVRRKAGEVGPGIEVVAADAGDAGAVRRAAEGAAALYHCLNPAYTSQAWQTEFPRFGTALIDAAIATGARLVCLDNLYAYGPVDAALTEDTPLAPAGSKGRVRAELSRALADAAATRGLRYTVGRAGDFFGPGVEQSVMSITPIRAGRSSWLVGDPQAVHAFSYAPDVARGLAALGTAAADVVEGRTFHLPVLELAPAELHRRLGEAVGVRAGYRTLGPLGIRLLGLFVPVVRELPETYYQWARPFRVDDRRFRASFPDIGTPLDQAVRETAAA